ncbi:MAG TPA: head GIN domain-containing protein [Bacteroidaceae bacterium]|nr:head GIN domain-containing protein [Bacteroidaceae bacterium]
MNHKSTVYLFLATFCLLSLSACSCTIIGMNRIKPSKAQSEITTEFKTLKGVMSSLPFDMVLTQHPQEVASIKMTGPNNYIELVHVDYSDGILSLRLPPRTYVTKPEALKIYINVHDLQKAGVSGTGDMYLQGAFHVTDSKISSSGTGDYIAQGTFDFKTLDINNSGTGDVTFKNHHGRKITIHDSGTGEVYMTGISESIDASTSGTGDVYLSGTSQEVGLRTSGTGDITGKNLTVQDARLHTSGTGDISCTVINTIDASTSGTGDVTIYGQPKRLQTRESGTGDIDFRPLSKK